jgi:hypothetical protein
MSDWSPVLTFGGYAACGNPAGARESQLLSRNATLKTQIQLDRRAHRWRNGRAEAALGECLVARRSAQ